MLGWIRGDAPVGNLGKMGEIVERLERAATTREVHQLWWVIGGVVESLIDGGLETSVSLKRLMGQADREMKRLATDRSGRIKLTGSPSRSISKFVCSGFVGSRRSLFEANTTRN